MLKYFSWRNWAVIEYNSMTENFFLFFYLALRHNIGGERFLLNLFLFYLFGAFATSYGYLVNDLGDRELDLRHGKPNVFHGDSTFRAIIVVLIAFLAANAVSLYFIRHTGFLPLWILWILLSTGYSLPPLRLKEKGFYGLMAVVPAQRIIPALLVLSVFGDFTSVDSFILICFVAVGGFMSDVKHQISDFALDASTGTETFVMQSGLNRAKMIFRYLLFANLLFQMLLYICACFFLPHIRIGVLKVPVAVPILIVYSIALSIHIFFKKEYAQRYDPYIDRGLGHFIHLVLPTFYFPFFLIVLHSCFFPLSLIALLFFLLLKKVFLPQKIRETHTFRLLRRLLFYLKKLQNT